MRGVLTWVRLYLARNGNPRFRRWLPSPCGQGQAVYLSDLVPKRYEFTPFFLEIQWPLVPDANVAGRQLSLGNDFYDKGLGMHTKSQVTYALDGNYRWFEARVGLEGTGSSAPGEGECNSRRPNHCWPKGT